MSSEPQHSQLPLASIRTDSGVTLAPRLALDEIELPDAMHRVLGQVSASRARASDLEQVPDGVATGTLDAGVPSSWLMLIDLSGGNTSLHGSLLVQALLPDSLADLEPTIPPEDPSLQGALQSALRELAGSDAILAARWRGAAGLAGCLLAMAGPGSPDVAINIDPLLIEGYGDGRMDSGEAKNWTTQVSGLRHELTLRVLFNEAPGLVLQVADARRADVLRALRAHGLGRNSHFISHLIARSGDTTDGRFSVWRDTQAVFSESLAALRESASSGSAPGSQPG